MTFRSLLALSLLAIATIACQKSKTETAEPIDFSKLTDSCAYTLDGHRYSANRAYSSQQAGGGANLDTTGGTWKWDADTAQYKVAYSISGEWDASGNRAGDLTVGFVKNFAKSQLTRTVAGGIAAPASDAMMYSQTGAYNYATDHSRFNRQSGVVLQATVGYLGNVKQTAETYSKKHITLSTAVTATSQRDSRFEILKVYTVPATAGRPESHIIEARFNAILFDSDEQPHRLDNGYIRIRID